MSAEPNSDKTLTAHVTRMLTLSTAHIDEKTTKLLDEEAEANKFPSLSVYPKTAGDNFGWFIYISASAGKALERMPKSLADCVKTTLAADCEILCLDADGPIIDALPTYDW